MAKGQPDDSASRSFLLGVQVTLPLILGAIPFGILFGTLAVPSGLSAAAAMAMSLVVFAGSAQFIVLGLMASGVGLGVIVLTTFVVNLRHLLYSAALVNRMRELPQRWRIPLAFWLTDETFAAVSSRMMRPGDDPHVRWFYLGSALSMYLNWQLCTVIGLMLGQVFPDMVSWGLDFAMSVTFIGMVAPYLRSYPMWLCVITAGILSVVTADFPHKTGLLVSAVTAMLVGYSAWRVNTAKGHVHE